MLEKLLHKGKEATLSVLPITFLVLILSFTPFLTLSIKEIFIFLFCSILLILGISLFTLGTDIAMGPMGEKIGSTLTKTKKILLISIVCFIMGLLITIAEPDLSVLAEQVKNVVSGTVLIASIGIGVGIFLMIAVLKIIFKKDLNTLLMFFYMILFSLVAILFIQGKGDMLALAFDSGGVTTGPITVPFIMALGVGIAATIGGRNANENSFGLVAMGSIGPIIAILILSLAVKGNINYQIPDYSISSNFFKDFGWTLLIESKNVIISLGLIVLSFLVIQFIYLKLSKKELIKISIGLLYTFFGLVIFLTAVYVGFMPIGFKMGVEVAKNKVFLVIFGFILGLVVVLAEPAIHILTSQVETITNGGISKKSILIALCIGVGVSICLSLIRVIFNFSVLYYLIVGYIISFGLSLFVPKMYTAIAFDSGGVASGPLTSSFILPFAIGACVTIQGEASVIQNAFGLVAMVAMTPLITIQVLGFKHIVSSNVKERLMMKKIVLANDDQVINFEWGDKYE